MAAAAVVLSPQPESLYAVMSSKRVPLANNPNAANSPYRATAAKRARSTTNEHRELESGQSPPRKKQLLDTSRAGARRPQPVPIDDAEGKVFSARPDNVPQNAFQKKLVALRDCKAREQKPIDNKERERVGNADAETIKQWRRHYRKVFPSFVFYFESLPQDVCIRSSRQITMLGAREEKFFSKSVTHVVTTRAIPSSATDPESNGSQTSSSRAATSQGQAGQTRTINPSLLEKQGDFQGKGSSLKGRTALDAAAQRKSQTAWQENDTRRQQAQNADILFKAREMNIKIWPLEKFERMMRTLFDADWSDSQEGPASRKPANSTVAPLRGEHAEKDLSQLLRNEKNLPTERTPWSDIIPFRGLYIYVHDVDEKTKPVLVREYPKVTVKEEGDWPQFRCVPLPRCPFIEDNSRDERENQKKDAGHRNVEEAPRTRAVSAAIDASKGSKCVETSKHSLIKEEDCSQPKAKPVVPQAPTDKGFQAPPAKPNTNANTDSLPASLASRFQVPGMPRPGVGREPLASGLQRSNQTSAIRSQMISSTAANPTARAGTSKEMHQLQRRAVEQRRSGLSANSVPSSYMNDVRAAINNDQPPTQKRSSKHKPGKELDRIHEDETQSEEDESRNVTSKCTTAPKKKPVVRKEPKPGYCENCKDKYDDFSEHIESRKHKKFALDQDNFAELDDLLQHLVRM